MPQSFRRILAVLTLVLGAAVALWAASPADKMNGKWTAKVGDRQYLLDLKVKDGDISGTVTLPDKKVVTISDGLVIADEFSFTTEENSVTWEWNGEISEASLEGERERPDEDVTEAFTAKRVN